MGFQSNKKIVGYEERVAPDRNICKVVKLYPVTVLSLRSILLLIITFGIHHY